MSASGLTESWLLEVSDSLRLPPLSPSVVNALLPIIELQLRRIIQQGNKFQRRSKSSTLKVEDINLVLVSNRLEPIYGLHLQEALVDPLGNKITSSLLEEKPKTTSSKSSSSSQMISLVEFADRSIPPCPLKPQMNLHWLAVQGVQPTIPENPNIVSNDQIEKLPLTIPKDLQLLYARITGILLSGDDLKAVQSVCRVLEKDEGLQDLLPYFSRFFYAQIKQHMKKLTTTRVMIRAIQALHSNSHINLETHLQQLLPAIFTCIVASKLSISAEEDHWSLRDKAAELIAQICHKYSAKFPELFSRVCKTYTDALLPDKSLCTVYGGIVGLRAMGHLVVKTVLLDQLGAIQHHLQSPVSSLPLASSSASQGPNGEPVVTTSSKSMMKSWQNLLETRFASDMCREALRIALGRYMMQAMNEPDLPWAKKVKDSSSSTTKRYNLNDLEERLVPFYVVTSQQLPYCREFI
eukprot:gene873-953_t